MLKLLFIIKSLAFYLLPLSLGFHSAAYAYKSEVLTDQLDRPWSLAFLPDRSFLVTEKSGSLRIVSENGEVSSPIEGVPDISDAGQGGLLEVALHPDFTSNRWVYLSYSGGSLMEGYGTEVIRAKLVGNRLTEHQQLFIAEPKIRSRRHFGGRLLFDGQGHLFIGLGDRGKRHEAQNPSNHIGTLVRLHDDGGIPADNPFVNTRNHRPEIYSYGHRNIQGMVIHPDTGDLWVNEHGPQGGDELNRIVAGKNYGWPVITFGAEYGTGFKIGEGTSKPGLEQPRHYWLPSIAPSGMAFYQNHFLIGALKFQLLAKLPIDNGELGVESRHFSGEWGRIRDVRVDKRDDKALIYLLTDSKNGKLIRIEGF